MKCDTCGSQLVFWGGTGGSQLYIINADGTGFRQLTSGPYKDTAPAWSPDSEWIAFGRIRCSPTAGDGPSELWIVRPDGSDLRQMVSAGAGPPEWSPNGELAYGNGSGLVAIPKLKHPDKTQVTSGPYFVNFEWGTTPGP